MALVEDGALLGSRQLDMGNSGHYHANKLLWGVMACYLLWYIGWSVAQGHDSPVVDVTYGTTVLCTWMACACVAIRWLVLRMRGQVKKVC